MAFYKRPGLGATPVQQYIDPNAPWYQQLFTTVQNVAQDVTQQPVQSVNALTAEVSTTRQTVLLMGAGLAAIWLLTRRH